MSRPRGSPRRRLIILSGALPVVLASVLVLYRPSLVGRLDDSTYDLLLRSAQATRPAAGVVVVDVDERSLTTVGQWPWRRDVIGRLISRLRDAGASVIALDVIFPESDRFEQDSKAGRNDGSDMTPDGQLAATIAQQTPPRPIGDPLAEVVQPRGVAPALPAAIAHALDFSSEAVP